MERIIKAVRKVRTALIKVVDLPTINEGFAERTPEQLKYSSPISRLSHVLDDFQFSLCIARLMRTLITCLILHKSFQMLSSA